MASGLYSLRACGFEGLMDVCFFALEPDGLRG